MHLCLSACGKSYRTGRVIGRCRYTHAWTRCVFLCGCATDKTSTYIRACIANAHIHIYNIFAGMIIYSYLVVVGLRIKMYVGCRNVNYIIFRRAIQTHDNVVILVVAAVAVATANLLVSLYLACSVCVSISSYYALGCDAVIVNKCMQVCACGLKAASTFFLRHRRRASHARTHIHWHIDSPTHNRRTDEKKNRNKNKKYQTAAAIAI